MPAKIPKIPQSPDLKRARSTGMQFTDLRRSQARAMVNDLVAQGHLARDQVSAAVDEVIDMSRRRGDELRKAVQNEVQRQLGALGLATKTDLLALERRVARHGAATKKAPAKKKPAAKKAPAKPAAKKPAAKKAAAKKAASKPAPKAG